MGSINSAVVGAWLFHASAYARDRPRLIDSNDNDTFFFFCLLEERQPEFSDGLSFSHFSFSGRGGYEFRNMDNSTS